MSFHTSRKCTNCGHRWERPKVKGRPRTAFYTAFGETKHIDDWSFELDLSLTSLRYYAAKYKGNFEDAVRAMRSRKVKKTPLQMANEDRRKIIQVGNHAFLGPHPKKRTA